MNIKLILLISILICSSNVYSQKIIFYKDGHKVVSYDLKKLINSTSHEDVSVYLSNTRRSVQYKSIRLRTILNTVFKNQWKVKGNLEFYTKTRYRPQIPLSFMQYREPYLAFAMSNGKKFVQIDKTNANLVELAPLYLIWKKAKKMGYTEKRQFRKIYQIIGINLITDPQKGITRGQRLYNRYCIRCHAVKGSGGSIGPVLERSDIIKRWGRKKVVQYIIHPKQFNSQSKMPAFNYVEKKQRYPIVEQIVKYIETISPSNRQKKRSSKAESLNKIFN